MTSTWRRRPCSRARSFIAAHLRTALGSVFHPDVVQWCLTVPAMWSEAAKSKMRRAACRAGLVQVRPGGGNGRGRMPAESWKQH